MKHCAVVLMRALALWIGPWYYTPEFPVEFQHKSRSGSESSSTVAVECVAQQLFDVERFLRSFLDSYVALRAFNLVDYDLQLIRVRDGSFCLVSAFQQLSAALRRAIPLLGDSQ